MSKVIFNIFIAVPLFVNNRKIQKHLAYFTNVV